MKHEDAIKDMKVERYLLGELTGAELEEFEEHIFSCDLCANDARMGQVFIKEARQVFKESTSSAGRGLLWIGGAIALFIIAALVLLFLDSQ